MNWFHNLKISEKLLSVFFIVILLEAALGGFAIKELAQVKQASTEIATNWLPSIRTLGQLKLSLARVRSFELQHILTSDSKEFDEIEHNADRHKLSGSRLASPSVAKKVLKPAPARDDTGSWEQF